jgi:hypothetical protein
MDADNLTMKFAWLFWMMDCLGGGGVRERNPLWHNLRFRLSSCPKGVRRWYALGWPSWTENRIWNLPNTKRELKFGYFCHYEPVHCCHLHESLWKVLHQIVQDDNSLGRPVAWYSSPKPRGGECPVIIHSHCPLFLLSQRIINDIHSLFLA